ncbi:hypothetical protein HDU87_001012 [Geranomyces variabilis]|uniref:Uncharacterized protein n=1 Tax=Geranomyces variabilis TaxID=109894 RepID=A0AAD5TN90_9FUNG|nr:hypothetical protein HDU87_001012 [Geranomyces variabilis]
MSSVEIQALSVTVRATADDIKTFVGNIPGLQHVIKKTDASYSHFHFETLYDAAVYDRAEEVRKKLVKKRIEKALNVKHEPVMQFLLSEESWQKCPSIAKAAHMLTCGGLCELWAELGGDEALLPDLFASKDAAYLKRCFEDTALYLQQYAGRPVRTERFFDCHAVITLAKVPGQRLTPTMS